jgi:hypothetical protein
MRWVSLFICIMSVCFTLSETYDHRLGAAAFALGVAALSAFNVWRRRKIS